MNSDAKSENEKEPPEKQASEQVSTERTEAAPVQKPIVPKSASEALRPEPGTPPPLRRRSRHARSQIVVFANFMLSLLVLAVIGASVLFYFGKLQFDAAGPAPAASTFLVKRGSGIVEIADSLERRGLISDARIFRYGVRAYGHEKDMKAGEYEIAAHASMRDIMETLRSGKSILVSLTIPEGLTVQQIFERIAANDALAGDMPETLPPEGSMFADTLRFTRGTMRQEIISKLQAEQKSLIDEIWAKRSPDLPLKDVNEFVTLASIVEKETGVASERPHVASVFVNRLRKGMRLQSDPTIIYGLFGGKGKPADRPIFRSDIDKPTPYNTYIINGLPPTPVANPGRAALEAVANPLETNDLYFVADGTGGHVFSATLKEHNDNVRRWRSVEQQKKDEAAKAAKDAADGDVKPEQPGQ
ncbi:endolytic transglycosylase MltG [Phyllobacterium phragmitis]|uniref:endolytic transglycosylase MltG n=1 Tax=Phyllobacterium phragmitis TaxID=2670329 RepID=UPI0018ECE6B7